MTALLSGLWPIAFAAIGWVAFEFIGRPVRNFFDLRRETKKRMLLHWDAPLAHMVPPDERADLYRELKGPRAAFAELGAQLVSFDKSEWMAAWFVRRLGFDPASAGNILRGIAMELGTDHEDRDKNFRFLDATLKFRFDKKRPFYNPYNPGL